MATDTDVQFFSHLNGLVLGNNWGDMCNLLDACLVDGVQLTSVTAASIDEQGDIHLTLYAAHNCLLFQVIELSGFAPSNLNGKYRIKGTPSSTQLILKADLTGTSITTTGSAKIAPLGYDRVFTAQYKRVYRAKNPTDQHPFIRVDETLSGEGGGNYTNSYAKSAMVGLIENMTHIDDYADTGKLQLPLDTSDFTKNWKITGTGSSVMRGWSKWYWSVGYMNNDNIQEQIAPAAFNVAFTLCGDNDAFYFAPASLNQVQKQLWGCGLYNDNLELSQPWFLFAAMLDAPANTNFQYGFTTGGSALVLNGQGHDFITTSMGLNIEGHKVAAPVVPNFNSGYTNIFSGVQVPALEIPFYDSDQALRGTLKHVYYMGKHIGSSHTAVELAGNSMYVKENLRQSENNQTGSGGIYFYLGELE